jgi:hypothetical protein
VLLHRPSGLSKLKISFVNIFPSAIIFAGWLLLLHISEPKTINMKTKLYFIVVFTLIINAAKSQDSRIFATYYGDIGNESAFSTATDNAGNVFIAGITNSPNLGSGGFQNNFGGGVVDAFLVKFNSSGQRLWATYYGGTGEENNALGGKLGIATDEGGNVYLAGLTNSTNMASGGFQNSPGGLRDAYLVKFGPNGNRIWATYYGSAEIDYGYNVATDKAGSVYLTGITASTANIASGGFQNSLGGGTDAFLVKFDSSGNRLWSTYYGGTGTDEGYSLTTDDSANVYLAGATGSTSGISSGGAQNNFGGGANDAFLVKFDSSGSRIWATYFGGSGDEMVTFSGDIDVAIDELGNAYLSGLTTSTNTIGLNGFQNSYAGNQDAFVAKYDPAGNRLWSTYYGGPDNDRGYSIATDVDDDVYLVGRTTSSSGISSGGFMNNYGGNQDGFLVKFHPDGSRVCASYYGGNDFDTFDGLAIDNLGNAYASGNAASTTGISAGGFQNVFGGGSSDAYLVKFHSCGSTVGFEKLSSNNYPRVYPNPSTAILNLSTENNSEKILEITDMMGKLIYRTVSEKQEMEINISAQPKGIYIVRIISEKNNHTAKILIE